MLQTLPAQEPLPETGLQKFEEHFTREILPGLETARSSEVIAHRESPAWAVLFDSEPQLAVSRVLTPGPWISKELAELVGELEYAPSLVLSYAPSPLDPPWLDGFHFDGERIHAWPPEGVVLRVSPEERFELDDAEAVQAWLATDDGTRFEVFSLNGRAGSGLSLYSGEFVAATGVGQEWPAGTIAVPLQPGSLNARPHRSVWDSGLPPEHRQWVPSRPVDMDRLSLQDDQYALVLPPDLPGQISDSISGSKFLILDFELDLRTQLSLYTTTAGRWFLRQGELLGGHGGGEADVRTFLATDSDGRRLWFFEFGSESSATRLPSAESIAGRLLETGVADAAVLPPAGSRLMIGGLDPARMADLSGRLVRRALVVQPGRPELPGLGEAEGLVRIDLQVSDSSPGTGALTGPESLIDGQARFDRSMTHYWSADASDQRPWVEYRLLKPARIGAIDVVHASACGFSGHFNVRSFRILGRANAAAGWSPLATAARDEPVDRERIQVADPRPVEWIRLEIDEPAFQPGVTRARLCELIVWGESGDENH